MIRAPIPTESPIDPRTGVFSRAWYRFFTALASAAEAGTTESTTVITLDTQTSGALSSESAELSKRIDGALIRSLMLMGG